MRRSKHCLLLFLFWFGLLAPSALWAAGMTAEQREILCEHFARVVKGVTYFEELCTGKLTTIRISEHVHTHIRGGLRKGSGEPLDFSARIVVEYHTWPWKENKKP